jgi:hypothetical protein
MGGGLHISGPCSQGTLVNLAQIGHVWHLEGNLIDRVECWRIIRTPSQQGQLVVRIGISAEKNQLNSTQSTAIGFRELQHGFVKIRHTLQITNMKTKVAEFDFKGLYGTHLIKINDLITLLSLSNDFYQNKINMPI